jgi:hypothetical protein
MKVAPKALASRAAHGWVVTATVVDLADLVIVQLRGDYAHRKDRLGTTPANAGRQ